MISSLPNNIFSRGKGSHLPITNNVVYIQRGRLCGSRFQKEKFILHHQPLNHTKTFLIHHLTWFLSRRLGVRVEFQSWSRSHHGRRTLPVYGVQSRPLGMIGVVFLPADTARAKSIRHAGETAGAACAQ